MPAARCFLALWCLVLPAVGLAAQPGGEPVAVFWKSLQEHCGQAFTGQVMEGTAPGDAAFRSQPIVMHVRRCDETQIHIALHVGDDRSRTWILSRLPGGRLRLKHDHRHEDGSEDATTQYGGDTTDAGTAQQQEFPADAYTAQLLPAAKTNIWTMAVTETTFSYRLRREAEGRRFRIDFDLTQPVDAPPPAWGHP